MRRAAAWIVSPSGMHPRVRCAAVKLVTWNVNSLRPRMPRVLELLDAHRPDLLFLQETKTEPDDFPELELNAAGCHSLHHSTGRWAGVAIATRRDLALDDVCIGLQGEPSVDEARWIEASVAGLRAVSVYVPQRPRGGVALLPGQAPLPGRGRRAGPRAGH